MVTTRRVKGNHFIPISALSLKSYPTPSNTKRKSLSPHIDQLTILLLKTVKKFTVKPQKGKKKKSPHFPFQFSTFILKTNIYLGKK